MRSLSFFLFFLLFPNLVIGATLSPASGSDLDQININDKNSSYRYYLFYEIPSQASSWPPTSGYMCGSSYAVVESTSPAGADTAQELWDNSNGGGGPQLGTCPATEDQVGTWSILETDTGSYMSWDDFEISEPLNPPTATTTIYYSDWLFVNSVIIGLLGFLGLGFILNPIKK